MDPEEIDYYKGIANALYVEGEGTPQVAGDPLLSDAADAIMNLIEVIEK